MLHLRFLFLLPVLAPLVARAQAPSCPPPVSKISVDRGWFESSPGVRYRLTDFKATLIAKGRSAPTCYEKTTLVSRAEIFVTNESLSNVFAQKLQKAGSKIKNFQVLNDSAGATLTGSIVKLIPIHFSIEGPVSSDGHEIRLTARSIKADGIPIQDVLTLVGAELNSILGLKGMPGIKVEDSALSFSPENLAHVRGHIASIQTSSRGLTLLYGPDASSGPPPTIR